MPIFFDKAATPVEEAAAKVEENPMWPFEDGGDGALVYRLRFTRFYFSVACLLVSGAAMGALAAVGLVGSGLFLWAALGVAFSAHSAYVYRIARFYILWPALNQYAYQLGDEIVNSGGLHNFYVRLRKRFGEEDHYFLTISGYGVDKQIITGATPDAAGMRAVGQRVARNLGINYFDEKNLSQHHRVVHFRPAAAFASTAGPGSVGGTSFGGSS